MSNTPDNTDIPGPSNEVRPVRREVRKRNDKLKRKIAEIRAPKSQKLTLITDEFYQKLQNDEEKVLLNKEVKNKHFRATQVEFALTDFVVKKDVKRKPKPRRISGTTVQALKKGKVREIPKRKSLSKLKRAIVDIREKRKKDLEPLSLVGESQEKETLPPIVLPLPATLTVNLPIPYSRKFRSYCDHCNLPDISSNAEKLLLELFRFQDRAYERNQLKAQAHRRYVVGIKEVERSFTINKLKYLLIATDLEPSPGKGGLDESVERLKDTCKDKSVPYCFPLQRRKIGYLLYKKAPISCVGIWDFDGAEDSIKALSRAVNASRKSLDMELQKLQIN